MMRLRLFIVFLGLVLSVGVFAQKVAGFYGDWHPKSELDRVQWDKLTDVYYAFMYTNGSGVTRPATTNGYTNTLQPLVTNGHANGVKVHISLGGANHNSAEMRSAVNNKTNLVNNIINTIRTYDLDGFNMDWEFPAASDANSLAQFMVALRAEMDDLEVEIGKELELSAAVGPLLWNSDGINNAFVDACDYIYLMAFDSGGGSCVEDKTNHSSLLIAQRALDKWTDQGLGGFTCGGNPAPKNVDPAKIVLSIPFYSAHPYGKYKDFSKSNQSQYFNDPDGIVGQWKYNSKPLIEAKAKLIMETYGGAGIWCWELPDDSNDEYSLLGAMHTAMKPYLCDAPQPDLGADLSICGQSSVNLNGNVSGSYTYSWKKNGSPITGSQSSLTVNSAGLYELSVSNGTCASKDQVEVLGVLPAIDLGGDIELCSPAQATLDAQISGNGYVYTWERDGAVLAGQNSQTLEVTKAGIYSVEVSVSGCTSTQDDVTVTSSLVDVDDKQICAGDEVTLSINSVVNGISYKWFSTSTGGSPLITGTQYMTPQLTADKTYYIEADNPTGGACEGVAEWSASGGYGDALGAAKVVYNGKLYSNTVAWGWFVGKIPGQDPYWKEEGICGSSCDRTPVQVKIKTSGCNVTLNPTITLTADKNNVCESETINLTANVSNAGNPTLIWQVNGAQVQESKATTYSSTFENGDVVHVTIEGTTVSDDQTLVLSPVLTPTVSISANKLNSCEGDNVQFTASMTNGGVATFKWFVGSSIVGNNSSTYSTTNLVDGDQVKVEMISSLSCTSTSKVTSNQKIISVQNKTTPTVSITSSALDGCSGENITFTATHNLSNATSSYKWFVDNLSAGSGSASFMSADLEKDQKVKVRLTASGSCLTQNTAVSNVLTVNNKLTTKKNGSIAQQGNQIGFSSYDIDLSDYFIGQNLTYSVSNSQVVNTNVSGSNLTISSNITGQETVVVTANGACGSATQTIKFVISDQPVIKPIVDVTEPSQNSISLKVDEVLTIGFESSVSSETISSSSVTLVDAQGNEVSVPLTTTGNVFSGNWQATQEGEYTLKITVVSSTGGVTEVTKDVIVVADETPVLEFVAFQSDESFLDPEEIELEAVLSGTSQDVAQVTFEISNDKGQLVEGINTTDLVSSWKPNESGTFSVKVIAELENGELVSSNTVEFEVEFVSSVSTSEIAYGLKAYPNPFNNYLILEMGDSGSTTLEVKIWDVTGREVFNRVSSRLDFESGIGISTADWETGVYLIRLSSDTFSQTIKVEK